MKKIFQYIIALIVIHGSTLIVYAANPPTLWEAKYPDGALKAGDMTLIGVLAFIQSILLKVVLPIVIVGGSLYIAYELFTAEGDETKMKKAWKSVTFSAIGLVCIAVSYAFVSLVSRISL